VPATPEKEGASDEEDSFERRSIFTARKPLFARSWGAKSGRQVAGKPGDRRSGSSSKKNSVDVRDASETKQVQ
jgi:hypothetical protein